jgi:hypothetical protein
MNALYNWNIEVHDRYMYCTGYLSDGKGWITSPIVSVTHGSYDGAGCYVIQTENSVYHLFW